MLKTRILHIRKRRGFFREPSIAGLSSEHCLEVYRSATLKTSLHSDSALDRWIANQLRRPKLTCKTISLNDMNGWLLNPETGDICHETGRFFSVTGAYIRHRTETNELEWDQPIIDQPEVGILGIAAKKFKGVLHFCLQAKEEPGNVNSVQLSPTVQATYSNYTRVHGGSPPKFIENFINPEEGRTILAKLQSEDGGRFLYKSNRNMIVATSDATIDDLPDNYIWVTLRQISRLLKRNNLVHACTRSILAALIVPLESDGRSGKPGKSNKASPDALRGTLQWIDNRKTVNHFFVKRRPLNTLTEWSMDRDGSFSHEEGRFFRVIGLDVKSTEREVSIWNQPILDTPGTGVIGILTKRVKGERYFLMQAKAEPGNRVIIQIGPTVQFMQQNYTGNKKLLKPFLFDEFDTPERFPLIHESVQSEEGARFYQETHIHRILELRDNDDLEIPPDYRWLSQAELYTLVNLGDTVNSCARSIISLLFTIQV
ncbi:MAG: NarL family transcriptional regulator [Geobacter sp.]|nr:NarL family transcriptional regulator [Geobacter sp.]